MGLKSIPIILNLMWVKIRRGGIAVMNRRVNASWKTTESRFVGLMNEVGYKPYTYTNILKKLELCGLE